MKTITITGTGLTGKQWVARLEKGNYKLSSSAKEIILSPDFNDQRLEKGKKYIVTFVKHSEVGISPTTQQIQKYAKGKGYGVASPEMVLLLREKMSNADIEKLGVWYVVGLHTPIEDSGGSPDVLNANRYDEGRWVSACWDGPGLWGVSGAFAFVLPASSSENSEPKHLTSDTLTLENAIKIVKEAGYKVIKEV